MRPLTSLMSPSNPHRPESPSPSDAEPVRVDVSSLFAACGIRRKVTALFNAATYEIDEMPQNNWLYPAFLGFQELAEKLRREDKCVQSFASIGTGAGLDVVGAEQIFFPAFLSGYQAEIFKPSLLVGTDVHPGVLPLAEENVRKNIDLKSADIRMLLGSLCTPLREAGLKVDVLYANLPLIPDGPAHILDGMRSSTFVDRDLLKDVPPLYTKHLLGMKYALLQDAHDCLTESGSVVLNLGGRVSIPLVHRMFTECGYSYDELVTMLKVQSQPEEVLPGFVAAEQKHGIAFEFYWMESEPQKYTPKVYINDIYSESFLKRNKRVSATEALALHSKGEKIGHIVRVIRGQRLD